MPNAPGRCCRAPGCPRISRRPSGYCEVHDLPRASSTQRGYDAAWQALRVAVLKDEPFCRLCAAAGRRVAAEHVDHIRPKRFGGTDDRDNLRPLCARCHNRRTGLEMRSWQD